MNSIIAVPLEEVSTKFGLQVPQGSRLVNIEAVNGIPTLWFEVNLKLGIEERDFAIVKTGDKIPVTRDGLSYSYCGTFVVADGQVSMHIYEKPRIRHPSPSSKVTGTSKFKKPTNKDKNEPKKSKGDPGGTTGPDLHGGADGEGVPSK